MDLVTDSHHPNLGKLRSLRKIHPKMLGSNLHLQRDRLGILKVLMTLSLRRFFDV